MLLIQSSDSDPSTDDVLAWLRYLAPQANIVRLNNETSLSKLCYRLSNDRETLDCTTGSGQRIQTERLRARWYRRGRLHCDQKPLAVENPSERLMAQATGKYIGTECRYLEEAIDMTLSKTERQVNTYGDNTTNKLQNLAAAAAAGLKIPDTLVTNKASSLREFRELHGRIITKAIAFGDFIMTTPTHIVHIGLNTLLLDHNATLPAEDTALPALYQQYMDKLYELRIFYLDGAFYPMAIFSQANAATCIDFRHYDTERPNRCVPYRLPEIVSTQLDRLMRSLSMNCGSIDMVVTPAKDLVFLEVNPVGQFQWLSRNCNYGIERLLARYLLNIPTDVS